MLLLSRHPCSPEILLSPGPSATEGQKRAACEVLYGKQNWDAIREAAKRDARNGAFPPEQLERMRIKQLE